LDQENFYECITYLIYEHCFVSSRVFCMPTYCIVVTVVSQKSVLIILRLVNAYCVTSLHLNIMVLHLRSYDGEGSDSTCVRLLSRRHSAVVRNVIFACKTLHTL